MPDNTTVSRSIGNESNEDKSDRLYRCDCKVQPGQVPRMRSDVKCDSMLTRPFRTWRYVTEFLNPLALRSCVGGTFVGDARVKMRISRIASSSHRVAIVPSFLGFVIVITPADIETLTTRSNAVVYICIIIDYAQFIDFIIKINNTVVVVNAIFKHNIDKNINYIFLCAYNFCIK